MGILRWGEEESHWYTKDGEPMYEIPQVTDPTKLRPVTARDAVKLELEPSVTNILGALRKPGLENWKTEQLIAASYYAPPKEGEAIEAFAQRVLYDSGAKTRQASELGSRIHEGIERLLILQQFPDPEDEIFPIMTAFQEWYEGSGLEHESCELTFAAPKDGYAGRVDWVGTYKGKEAVLDWKTVDTVEGEPIRFYPERGAQIAGYAHGLGQDDAELLIGVVSRTQPGRVELVPYTFEEYWPVFVSARNIFYSPVGKGAKYQRRFN